jgi:hypothetical protein
MAAFAAEGTAAQRSQAGEDAAIEESRTARDRAHQEERWQIEDSRLAEDNAHALAVSAIDDEIAKQQELAQQEQDDLAAVQSAWDSFAQTATADLSNLTNIASAGGGDAGQSGGGDPNPFGATFVRQLGGHWAGGAGPIGSEFNVGDAPGGGVTPYTERVRVTPQGVAVAPLANRPEAGGTTITIGDITVQASGDEEAIVARTMQLVEAKLRQAMRAGKDRALSLGRN